MKFTMVRIVCALLDMLETQQVFVPRRISFSLVELTRHMMLFTRLVFATLTTTESMGNVSFQSFVDRTLTGMVSSANATLDISTIITNVFLLQLQIHYAPIIRISMEWLVFAMLALMKFRDTIVSNVQMDRFGMDQSATLIPLVLMDIFTTIN